MVYLEASNCCWNIEKINKDWDRNYILHLNNFNLSKYNPFSSVFLVQVLQV